MTEEAFTITVSEFMNFPPTLDCISEISDSGFRKKKDNLFSKLEKLNIFSLFTEATQRAMLKKALGNGKNAGAKAEVFILNSQYNGAEVCSELIEHYFFHK